MKLSAIVTAVALAGIAGVAVAGNAAQTPRPLTASQVSARCMRPGQAPTHACDALYRLIRANFTPRELNAIATWEASHPEYLFTDMLALRERYIAVLQRYASTRQADAAKVAVAVK